jgi:hypothetical protein
MVWLPIGSYKADVKSSILFTSTKKNIVANGKVTAAPDECFGEGAVPSATTN